MKKIILSLFLSLCITASFAQKAVDFDNDPSFLDRVYVGGGLGFSTSNNLTVITLSPIVGYMITQNLSAGLGVQYQYVNDKFFDTNYNIYGGNVFTRYNFNQFFLQTEYNRLNLPIFDFSGNDTRVSRDRFLIGGGIAQPIGKRARINVVGFYDVLYAEPSVFASPWVFRVFISG